MPHEHTQSAARASRAAIDVIDWVQPAVASFGSWLRKDSNQAYKAWRGRLRSGVEGSEEGAIAEAVVFDYLTTSFDIATGGKCELLPGGEHRCGGPDFICRGQDFEYAIEVTNISMATAERRTGLVANGSTAGHYSTLTRAIGREVGSKEQQIARRRYNHPTLVFVTTLHSTVSAICIRRHHMSDLLKGTSSIQWDVNRDTGQSVGETRVVAELDHAVFARVSDICDPDGMMRFEYRNRNVSAILVGGFGTGPSPSVLGALNPNPLIPFDVAWLPFLPFATLRLNPQRKTASVSWSDESHSERPTPKPSIILPSEADYTDFHDFNG